MATSSKSRGPRIQEYIAHRNEREKQILALLKAGPLKIPELVALIYGGQELPRGLEEAAGWQVHAHLLKLKADGKVTGTSVKSAWKLAYHAISFTRSSRVPTVPLRYDRGWFECDLAPVRGWHGVGTPFIERQVCEHLSTRAAIVALGTRRV